MNITNEECKKILKSLREIDDSGIKSISEEDLAETLVALEEVIKEFNDYKGIVKRALILRDIQDQLLPKYGKKVILGDGNKSTKYDIKKMYKNIINDVLLDTEENIILQGLGWKKAYKKAEMNSPLRTFLNCLSFVQAQAKEEKTIIVEEITKGCIKIDKGLERSKLSICKLTLEEKSLNN